MGVPVFVAELSGAAEALGAEIRLDGPEGRHAAAVVRLEVGQRLDLVDGAGTRVHATVVSVGRDDLIARADEVVAEPPPSPRLIVVQALVKGDRATTAVETLTEVGVDVVVPWQAARSVSVWRDDRVGKHLARWRAVAREAGKQSRRARHLEVRALHSTADVGVLLASAVAAGGERAGLVLHEEATDPLPRAGLPSDGDLVVVVGPEGGITDDELAAFTATGARSVRLGPSVLRASTAGTAAAAVLLAAAGRWG